MGDRYVQYKVLVGEDVSVDTLRVVDAGLHADYCANFVEQVTKEPDNRVMA